MTKSGAWVAITSPVLSSHSLRFSNTKLLVLCTCSAVSFLPDLTTESFYSECAFLGIVPPTDPSFRIYTGTISSRQHYLTSTLTFHFARLASWHIPPLCLYVRYKTLSLQFHAILNRWLCVFLTNYTESSGKKDYVLIHLCPWPKCLALTLWLNEQINLDEDRRRMSQA